MAWTEQICFLCNRKGKIEIGRNIDRKTEDYTKCPMCEGKGLLTIYKVFWGKPHRRFPKFY